MQASGRCNTRRNDGGGGGGGGGDDDDDDDDDDGGSMIQARGQTCGLHAGPMALSHDCVLEVNTSWGQAPTTTRHKQLSAF